MSFQRVSTIFGRRPLQGKARWLSVFAALVAIVLAPVVCRGLLRNTDPHPISSQSGPSSAAAANHAGDQKSKKAVSPEAITEQQKQIAEDSTQLLKMATELKKEVDKTNKDVLSVTVIRKADAIEKLAHDVKEKMKTSMGME